MATDVFIQPKVAGKGRTFRAMHLASVLADNLWPGGATDTKDIARPVYATFLGTDAELRSFTANLLLGRRATLERNGYRRRDKGFEFLKSAGYKCLWQREAEGSAVTLYLPELFLLDPGMVDPKEAKFVLLPPCTWAQAQALETDKIVRHARRLPVVKTLNTPPTNQWERERWVPRMPDDKLAAMVPVAYLFAAYLDRRTRAPLYADGRFYLQLLLECLDAGFASWSSQVTYGNDRSWGRDGGHGFDEDGTTDAGLLPGVSFRADHASLEALLADSVARFFSLTKGK